MKVWLPVLLLLLLCVTGCRTPSAPGADQPLFSSQLEELLRSRGLRKEIPPSPALKATATFEEKDGFDLITVNGASQRKLDRHLRKWLGKPQFKMFGMTLYYSQAVGAGVQTGSLKRGKSYIIVRAASGCCLEEPKGLPPSSVSVNKEHP